MLDLTKPSLEELTHVGVLAMNGVSKLSTKSDIQDRTQYYRQSHPNTNLTNTQISRMIENGDLR